MSLTFESIVQGSQGNTTSVVDDSDLLYTLLFYGPIGVAVFLLFCILRRHAPAVYAPRTSLLDSDTTPPPLRQGYFEWVPQLFSSTNDMQVLDKVGFDAFVYLRVLTFSAKLFAVTGPLMLAVLGTTYAVAGAPPNGSAFTGVTVITLTNVGPHSSNPDLCYWFACVACFLFTAVTLRLLQSEYAYYITCRQEALAKRSANTFSVLVERIPDEIRSEELLYRFFENLFPGEILDVQVVPLDDQIAELRTLVEERHSVLLKLERARYDENNGYVVAPAKHLHFTDDAKHSTCGTCVSCGCIPLDSRACCYGALPRLCGVPVDNVESVAWYGKRLHELNTQIPILLKKILSENPEDSRFGGGTIHEDNQANASGPAPDPSLNIPGSPTGSKFSQPKDDGEGEWLLGNTYERPSEFKQSGAFVTFRSLMPRNIVAQCAVDAHAEMITSPAPEYNDVVWENVGTSKKQRAVYTVLVNIVNAVLLILFGMLTAVISATTNLEFIRREWKDLDNFLNDNPWLIPLFSQIAPLLLIIAFALVPPILWNLLRLTWPTSFSSLDRMFYTHYFVFLVIQVFLFFQISGTLFTILGQVYNNPQELVTLLAKTIPYNSSFFLQYVLVRILWVLPVELVRLSDLAVGFLVLPVFCGTMRTPRERREAPCGCHTIENPGDAWHAKNTAQAVLILVMGITYSAMAPLMLIMCGIFAVVALFTYRYMLQFVYINVWESNGRLWARVFWSVVFGLMLLHGTMIGVFALAGATVQSVLMAVLLLVNLGQSYYIYDLYEVSARYLPLKYAKNKDYYTTAEENHEEELLQKRFLHPVFKAASVEVVAPGVDSENIIVSD